MPLPEGISTAQVTFGRASGVLGTEAVISAWVETNGVVIWAPTGQAIYPFAEPVTITDGVATFRFPHVDQEGFVDEQGATITGFWGVFTARIQNRAKRGEFTKITKEFQVLVADGAQLELRMIPDGLRRPESAIAARSYADQAREYRDQAAAQVGELVSGATAEVTDMVSGATAEVGQLVTGATGTLDTKLAEAEADLHGIAGGAAASASAAASAAEAASASAGDADMARLGALAAQEAAEAAQQAALEQVAAATAQATAAAEQATAAAGSAAAASGEGAAAETARIGAEAAQAAIPSMPVLAQNRMKKPRSWSQGGVGQAAQVTLHTTGGPDSTPDGGGFTRKTFTAPSSMPASTDIFFSSTTAEAIAEVSPGEYVCVFAWVRSSAAPAVRVAAQPLSSIAPVSGAPGGEGGDRTVLTPNQWTFLIHPVSVPMAAEARYVRVDIDAGNPPTQFGTGDTMDVGYGGVFVGTSTFRHVTNTPLAPFSDKSAGARLGSTGLPELVAPRREDIATIARSATRFVEGTGSPEGRVYAPIGTTYLDLAASPAEGGTGAYEWRKRTASGATGWQVVDGDTGWRDLTGQFINGWKVNTGGTFAVRRQGAMVWLTFHNLNGESATNLSLTASLGSAWAVHNPGGLGSQSFPALLPGGTPSTTLSGGIGTGGTPSMNGLPGTSTLYRGLWFWPVNPATWPTTLPGIAI